MEEGEEKEEGKRMKRKRVGEIKDLKILLWRSSHQHSPPQGVGQRSQVSPATWAQPPRPWAEIGLDEQECDAGSHNQCHSPSFLLLPTLS